MNKTYRQVLFVLLWSCSRTYVSSSASDPSNDGDIVHCEELWMGRSQQQGDTEVENDLSNIPGKLCVQMTKDPSAKSPQQNHLTVFHLLNDKHGYVLDESYLWLGNDPSAMPKSLAGWPYQYNVSTTDYTTKSDLTVNIPLNNRTTASFCQDGENGDTNTIYLAVHPVILRQSGRPVNEQKPSLPGNKPAVPSTPPPHLRRTTQASITSNGSNQAKESGFWWMEIELQVQGWCSRQDPSPSAPLPRIVQMQQRRRRLAWDQSRRRLSTACGGMSVSRVATLETEASHVLTEEFIHRFGIISTLSAKVAYDTRLTRREDYYRTIYDRFDAFDDGLNDAAAVAKADGVCYGVFRGTVEYNYFDELQNLMPGYKKVDGTDCYVRRGLYNAYFTNYMDDFEDSVRSCVNSCEEDDGQPCELVFTGGSQGAAAAVVAAIRHFEEYDPVVMSMGVMRTFLPTSPFDGHEPCTYVNKEKHYHFVLTDEFMKAYDPIPYVYAFWAKNVGHEILYDGDGNFNYQGLAPNYIMKRSPGNYAIHTRWNYVAKSQQAYDNACLPYPTFGWIDGHWCTEHENCVPTSYCGRGDTCQPKLEVGSDCHSDESCISGSCVDGICFMVSKKELLRPIGTKCWSNGQCGSGRCEGFIGFKTCQIQLETGASCNEHSDCLSGHCAGLIDGKCL